MTEVKEKAESAPDGDDLYALQRRRHKDDLATRFIERSRADRLKSVGLQLSALVGRMASGRQEVTLPEDILFLVAGAANAINQKLAGIEPRAPRDDWFLPLADAVGRLCSGTERLDHLEPFHDEVTTANCDIVALALGMRNDPAFRAVASRP